MPIPINLLVTPIAEVLKFMYLPLAKQISYVKDINNNSETLRRKSDELEHKLNDLKREIQRAAENGKIPTDEAIGWLGNARMVIDNALGLIKEVHQGSCCSIWCLHCCGTYQLGKKILETTDLANELLGKQINPIFVDPLREKVLPFPTLQIKENTSAGAAMEKILWYLRDGETGKIGIWGQRGIGKSTILKNIYNKFEGTSDYNAIIFVKFRKNEGLMRLVKDIAEDLALDLSKEEDQERGSRLIFKELKKRKFILILDGLCEVLNLTEIGIPSPSEQKGCKILMASEKREICSSMAADVEIMIDPLPMEEAWELFCDKVGNIPPEIKPIAKLVCQECSGIAALIVSLGTALQNQELFVWKKALKVLQSPNSQLVGPEKLVAAVLKEPYVDYTPESASGETSLGQLRRAPVNKSPTSQLVGPEKLVAAVLKEPYVDYTPESASGETSLGQLRRAPVNKLKSARIPAFGNWDWEYEGGQDLRPEGYTNIFHRVREMKKQSSMEHTISENQIYQTPIHNRRKRSQARAFCFCCGEPMDQH